jgi:hypothetical protein
MKKHFFNQWMPKNETELEDRVSNAIAFYEENGDRRYFICFHA